MAESNTGTPAGKRTRRGKTTPPAAPLTGDEQRSLSLGIAFGMACAAALSAPTLYGLARLIGFTRALAWLLPAALDGYAVTSIWFGRRVAATHPAAKGARRNARLALALTVACNGLYHLLTLGGVMIPVWARVTLLVAVSSLPPFLVDRLLHLRALASGNTSSATPVLLPATATPPRQATPPRVAQPALPAVANPQATPRPATVAAPPAAKGNTPIRLVTAAEKEAIVTRMLRERGDDVPLSEIAAAIGTPHRATAMKVRDRVIKARTEPRPAEADADEDPEPALAVS